MAKIICTVKDFHKYIGPRIRNIIQAMTKKRKKELNFICQGCNKETELEAAHIKGNGRKEIIDSLLKDFVDEKEIVKVDLDLFEKNILASHKPIDKYFRFLCSRCHMDYDK